MWGMANIPTFTPAAYQDDDTYGEDCTTEMTARQTTIFAVTLDNVERSDGVPTSSVDMQVSNVTVFAGGLKFAWKGIGGVRNTTYYITFELTLNSGDIINRTVCVIVPMYVG